MAKMKETIRSVAIDLIFTNGYFATSISDIANGAGIQKASIYHHYPSKEVLLYRIMEATMNDLMAALRKSQEGEEDPEGRMRAAVRSHVSFHLNRQKETFIAHSELRGLEPDHLAAIVAYRDEYERVIQDVIQDGIDAAIFAPNDVKILSYAILTLCTAGATWYKPQGRLPADAIATIYENFSLNGLKNSRLPSARPVEPACDPWPI